VWDGVGGVGVRSGTEVKLNAQSDADVERVAAQLRSNRACKRLTVVGSIYDSM
jgi:hypothetical protein